MCIKTWGGAGGKKTKPETPRCCALTGQEAMNSEIQKILIMIRKKTLFFTVQVVKHCKMLLREAVESPLMEIFKSQLDELWAICSRWLCLSRGWTRWAPEVSTNLYQDSVKRLLLPSTFYEILKAYWHTECHPVISSKETNSHWDAFLTRKTYFLTSKQSLFCQIIYLSAWQIRSDYACTSHMSLLLQIIQCQSFLNIQIWLSDYYFETVWIKTYEPQTFLQGI